MPTDLLSESRLSLTALAREQGVAVSTAWRWTLRGIRGVRLEAFNLGGRRLTTQEAFQRFVARTNGQQIAARPKAQREQDRQAARRQLAAAGLVD